MFGLHIKLRSLILLTLVPCLLFLILIYALIMYFDLYKVILTGFERKLYAISAASGSFIDGNVHKEITEMQQVRGLAFDSKTNTLYGNYYIDNRILAINTQRGVSRHLSNEIGFYGIEDIAFNTEDGFLYGLVWDADEEGNDISRLIRINTSTGIGSEVVLMKELYYGLAYDSKQNVLYCNNDEKLVRVNPQNGNEVIVGNDIGVPYIRGLAYHEGEGALYGVVTRSNDIAKFDLKTGVAKIVYPILTKDADRSDENARLLLGAFGLAFDQNKNKFYSSTTVPIVTIHNETGYSEDLRYQKNLEQATRQKQYLSYISPMLRIKNKKDLTFLYSSVLKNKAKTISYALDATQDEIHSYVGYEDPDEAEDDIRDVWLKGETYLSDIKYWEEWGLLKSAYNPILDQEGVVSGYAGADVNISVIEMKTNEAILKILAIGLFAVLLAVFVSFIISNRLIQTISNLKNGALQIAAGMFGSQISIQASKELQELSHTFNTMSLSLKDIVSQMNFDNRKILSEKLAKNLFYSLSKKYNSFSSEEKGKYLPLSRLWLNPEKEIDDSPCGHLLKNNKIIVWLATPSADMFGDLRDRNTNGLILSKMLAKYKTDDDLLKVSRGFLSSRIDGLFIYDIESGVLEIDNASSYHALEFNQSGPKKSASPYPLKSDRLSLKLSEAEGVIIGSPESLSKIQTKKDFIKNVREKEISTTSALMPVFFKSGDGSI